MQQLQSEINKLYQLSSEEERLKKELRVVSEKVKDCKKNVLVEIKQQQLEKRQFAIGDRLIKYKREKDTEGLTQRLLRTSLNKYFANNPSEAASVFDFIISSRNSKFVETIDIIPRKPTSATTSNFSP
jgi:hypothetical protein